MSSDLSDDEDWTDESGPKKWNKEAVKKASGVLPNSNALSSQKKSSRTAVSKLSDVVRKSEIHSPAVSEGPDSEGNIPSTSTQRKHGRVTSQKLHESFQENQYPTRKEKESLSEELGLTFQQVATWFRNTRHSFRVSSQEGVVTPRKDSDQTITSENYTKSNEGVVRGSASNDGSGKKKSVRARNSKVGTEHGNGRGDFEKEVAVDDEQHKTIARELRKKLHESFQENQYPTHEEKESLSEELGLTFQKVAKWFENTRRSFRVSTQEGVVTPRKDSDQIITRENYTKSNEGVVQGSASNDEAGKKKSVRARNSKVGTEHGNDKGDSEKEVAVAEEQQKAIARELRKKLHESFQENQYPTREEKESLSEELGLTFQQVATWFRNTRHSFRVSSQEGVVAPHKESPQTITHKSYTKSNEGVVQGSASNGGIRKKTSVQARNSKVGTEHGSNKGDSKKEVAVDDERQKAIACELRKKLHESFQENQYPTRKEKESLSEELGLTFQQVATWFRNTRHSFRVSSQEGVVTPRKDSNQARTCETYTKSNKGVVQGSASNKGRRKKKPVQARNSKVGTKHGNNKGASKKEVAVDDERQKAIARELRKMKMGGR